jgi:heme-degrading monooxygenase HmoA
MSVLMTMRVEGDTQQFRRFVGGEGERLHAIAEAARAAGCLHHRFGVGDGYVLVVDEWESPEHFQRFFEGNEEIAAVMRDAGARSEPEIAFSEAIATADQF